MRIATWNANSVRGGGRRTAALVALALPIAGATEDCNREFGASDPVTKRCPDLKGPSGDGIDPRTLIGSKLVVARVQANQAGCTIRAVHGDHRWQEDPVDLRRINVRVVDGRVDEILDVL